MPWKTNSLRPSGAVMIPVLALVMSACGVTLKTQPDNEWSVHVDLVNVRTLEWDGSKLVRGGSMHLFIPGAGESYPCCLVREGATRSAYIAKVRLNDQFFVFACPTTGNDHCAQSLCRVVTDMPRPRFTVTFDSQRDDGDEPYQLMCRDGWENTTGAS